MTQYLLQKALEKLESLGIIKREYINKTVHDSKLNNVQSITLVPERVAEITELPSCKNWTTLVQNLDEGRSKFKPPSSEILPTYTYNISNINQKGMNERMRGVGVFINSTKRRVDYEALSEELNADEMQYVDILVEVIAESIVGDVGDERIKIAGDYPVRTNVMPRLLKIGKQEVLTVAKNMYRRKKCNEIADMKAYLLKALDAELNKNYPFDDTVKDICAQ